MDKRFVEIFEYFRDVARNGVGPYDHAQVMDAKRDFEPPSKEFLAKRAQALRGGHRDKWTPYERSAEGERLLQDTRTSNMRFRMIVAGLGGNLATKAEAPRYDGDALRRIRNPIDRPIDNSFEEGALSFEQQRKRAHDAKKETILELIRLANPNNQPNWMDVVDGFGSYEEMWKHV